MPQALECQRVTINPVQLREQVDSLSLALSKSRTVVARKLPKSADTQADTVFWRGVLDGDPFSSVAFAQDAVSISGRVATSDGRVFRLRSSRGDGPIIEELNVESFLEHPPGGLPTVPTAAERHTSGAEQPLRVPGTPLPDACQLPGQAAICVLVVYTPAAAAWGEALLKRDIALAVDDTNFSLANSGVTQPIILAGMQQVDYVEVDAETDMIRLVKSGDQFMDDVHGLRDDVKADLVVLVTNWSEYGAWAYEQFGAADLGNHGFADKAFAIVSRRLLVNRNYAFAHELGHLMGANHDGMASGGYAPGPFCYSHGHLDPVPGESPIPGTPCPPWRTVMGEAGYCPACLAQPYWSSSDESLNFCGRLLGNAQTEDNARTLNQTAATVAGFR